MRAIFSAMKATELKILLEQLIAEKGSDVEIEVSVDVGSDADPFARAFGRPIELMRGLDNQPGVLLCEEA